MYKYIMLNLTFINFNLKFENNNYFTIALQKCISYNYV